MEYRDFLEAKVKLAEPFGFEAGQKPINQNLNVRARVIVPWALEEGAAGHFRPPLRP